MYPFFSIIIPVYNVAPFLRECLDSVLAQTIADWECICVDDGSTDGSGPILDEYAAKDSRFRVIHQANKGVGEARNVGLEVARGKWVLFLDGDDVWHVSLLAVVLKMIETWPNEKLIRFSFDRFESVFFRGKCKYYPDANMLFFDISKKIAMRELSFFFFCCYAYRKDLLDGIDFPRYIRGEDRCVLSRIQLTKVNSFVATEVALYGYRKRCGSAMNSRPSMQVLRDEMDHRLDIMEMIDASGKHVDYAGHYWLEGYFTHTLPMLSLARPGDARAIVKEWRMRLPRLLQCQGLSSWGRRRIALSSSHLFRPVGDLLIFTLPYLRNRIALVKPIARLYRRLVRHGVFARKEMP